MPQLNPAPWLFIFLLSWVVLLLIFKTKVTLLSPMNNPSMPAPLMHQTAPWNWPWA
uniref:ATP synthase complex subunit 8 n=1 Tax=Scincella huanrenensis TaxID=1884398 RepID=A0A1B2AMT7_9SAUR|nr:ATP synthase F0 subunit 8 [Scincella huanrenensis]ANY28503.1 ATP synthase F0 subunit 8 [Scincella huanrenensis]